MPHTLDQIRSKIFDWPEARKWVRTWQAEGLRVVFTNGCFDILHYGHVYYLAQARDLGDRLVVGLNSAASVRRLKGRGRPIHDERTRTHLLAALWFVDGVVCFEEDTPLRLIEWLRPDVLVKGGDYAADEIVGAEVVRAAGGRVCVLPFVPGYSTTAVERKIRNGGAQE